ncbi:Gart [Symbiodinium necroappetens]|uniref:Gart protein n=1 Tax=Symbiodinium necroappetens TaxID=1628268 RepID=A0A812YKH2_9DINO|nr:Gart [Symbiodinium necroappetens]
MLVPVLSGIMEDTGKRMTGDGSTNGIGTKLKVATAMGQFRSIGTDLLALCANDIAARGAEPLMFSSHHSCCQLDAQQALEVGLRGLGV